MFKIKLTARAKKEIKNLSTADKLHIAEVIEDLKDDPLGGKPLSRELVKKFSYRIGVYRVIYLINKTDHVVTILSIGHRASIYK